MSKQIKQMEMDALKQRFQDVRDLVILTSDKLDCQTDYQMRAGLRKKNIRMQMVKNSLARRVFDELGVKFTREWTGTTIVAWGAGSLAELSKEFDALSKKYKKIQVKGAVSEGQEIEFKQALAMPTRAEAIGRVVGLAMAPAARLMSQILGPGSQIVGQIKSIAEKAPPTEGAPGAEAAAPAAG
jgi:large subunit ribosomal protein L10